MFYVHVNSGPVLVKCYCFIQRNGFLFCGVLNSELTHTASYRIILDCSQIDLIIKTNLLLFKCRFSVAFCSFFFPLPFFCATLVCHVAIALCNIYSMTTGKTNSMDVMSLQFAIVFSLVLSDLGVTKPSLLCHIKRVFQVTLLVSVKIRLYGVLLLKSTLN